MGEVTYFIDISLLLLLLLALVGVSLHQDRLLATLVLLCSLPSTRHTTTTLHIRHFFFQWDFYQEWWWDSGERRLDDRKPLRCSLQAHRHRMDHANRTSDWLVIHSRWWTKWWDWYVMTDWFTHISCGGSVCIGVLQLKPLSNAVHEQPVEGVWHRRNIEDFFPGR